MYKKRKRELKRKNMQISGSLKQEFDPPSSSKLENVESSSSSAEKGEDKAEDEDAEGCESPDVDESDEESDAEWSDSSSD